MLAELVRASGAVVSKRTCMVSESAPETPASATAERNTSAGTFYRSAGSVAVTVAVRGTPWIRPISPK